MSITKKESFVIEVGSRAEVFIGGGKTKDGKMRLSIRKGGINMTLAEARDMLEALEHAVGVAEEMEEEEE